MTIYHPELPDWNAGYLTGEAERLTLATALDACRYDLQQALERITELEHADNPNFFRIVDL